MSPLVDRGHSAFRDWFRKVWKVRGGGLYACGFAVTFVVLEIGELADDVAGIGMVFSGQAIEFLIGFIVDSFTNTIRSFAWPVYVVQWMPPVGAIGLGLAFWLFPIYVKPHIEGWLFHDVPSVSEDEKVADNETA